VPSEIVSLEIGGIAWKGWTEVSITRAVDAVSGAFELSLTDRWSHDQVTLPIMASQPVSIKTRASAAGSAESQLIRGYIDTVAPKVGTTSHMISISGRDASEDLVDCAAVHKPGHWKGLTCSRLAEILAAPFGVSVRCTAAQGAAIPVHKIEPGETAWECLERALRQRELIAFPDAKGGILIAQIGTGRATTALVQGQNVKDISAKYDAKGRFSEYRVLAQNKGSDSASGDKVAAVVGIAHDNTVGRYRPHVITGESPKDAATSHRRAAWEASVRAGRSFSVDVIVQGWRQGDGSLWPLNAMCRATLPYLRLDQDLMIGKVVHKLGNEGTTTTLTLKSPLAYAQEFEKKIKKEKSGDGGDALKGALELSKAEQAKILAGGK